MLTDDQIEAFHGKIRVTRRGNKITLEEFDKWAGQNGKWYVYHTFTKDDYQAMTDKVFDIYSDTSVLWYMRNVTPNRTVAPK